METSVSLLASLSTELANVVEKAGPSVVRIDDGSRLTATGVIWTADGLILASSHGTERDEEVVVEMSDGARQNAALIGRDADTDLALLKVDASGLLAIESAGIEDVKVGHLALALGRPGDSGLQATIGIVSALLETQMNGEDGFILNTDAVLYPGFSGGPLVDMNGRALGITNRMFGRGAGVAIGMSIAAQVAGTLLAHGGVPRGYLGISTQLVALPAILREKLSLEQERTLLIVQVEPGSPAESGGLLLGDSVLSLNGQVVQEVDDLRRSLRLLHQGQTITLGILRGGERRDLEISLGGGKG